MTMTKVLATVISTAMFFLFAAPSHANVILSITPATQNVSVGSPVSIAIDISGLGSGTALGGYDLNIGFDSTLLSFTQAAFGDPLLGDQLDLANLGLNGPTATLTSGTVNLIEFSLDDPTTLITQQASSFTLAILSFNALTTGTSPITLSINGLIDANAVDIQSSSQNGSVTINGNSNGISVPEPEILFLLLSSCAAFRLIHRRSRFG